MLGHTANSKHRCAAVHSTCQWMHELHELHELTTYSADMRHCRQPASREDGRHWAPQSRCRFFMKKVLGRVSGFWLLHLAKELFFQLVGPALVGVVISRQVANVCTLYHHLHTTRGC